MGTLASSSASQGFYSEENYRLESSVGYLMRVAVESMSRELDERMAAHGLTDAQWRPLFFLARSEAQTAGQLARRTECDAGAVTRMLDRLEEKGFVRRIRSIDDRRVQNLELTDEGRKAAAVVPRVICEVINSRLEGFTAPEVEQLLGLLQRVVANCHERGQPRTEKESAS